MRIWRVIFATGLLGVATSAGAPAAYCQQQSQDQPIPAYRSTMANSTDYGIGAADPNALTPDDRPLTGVQDLSVGFIPTTHSYWTPHVDVSTMVDSNSLNANNSTGWGTWTTLLGGIDLRRISGTNDLTISYVGGGMISNNGNSNNSVTQGLKLAERISFRRSTLSFFDQLNYSPERFYGYNGLGGISLPGGGSLGLQPGVTAGQPILTTNSQIITNSFLTQFDTELTPRTSVTLVGGYSLLNYSADGFLNYGDMIFQGGYNYQATRRDTVGVFYRFNGYRQFDSRNLWPAGDRETGFPGFERSGPGFIQSADIRGQCGQCRGGFEHSNLLVAVFVGDL